jgi:predicted  nucleic acid-binding Zn-ribbon protein
MPTGPFSATGYLEADKKAFHAAMAKAQSHIDAATAEIQKLRAELKTQTTEAKDKTIARVDELTRDLDATRKGQQADIEAHLKKLHTDIDSLNAELKHATAQGKVEVEAKARAVREEYDAARKVLTASLDAELAEWKDRIGAAVDLAAGKKADAKTAVKAKIADLKAKHEAAQRKLHALKHADMAAFDELHHGVRTARAAVKTALQHAHADIAAAL